MSNISTPAPNYTGPVVIDPVTRLEGHLRVEVELNNGKITDAYSSMTLFRGLEIILKGRDPQDAQHFTQRTCGVCTFTHALASTRAVEDALGVDIPPLAVDIRNLVFATHMLHDHLVHFYHLHALDFVNVANCLNADPKKTADIVNSISTRKTTTAAMQAVKDRIKKFIDSGQLGPFTNAYFLGEQHPAYRLSPELDLIGTAHYLEALHMQVKVARACAIFGAKHPHPQFTVVGGVTCYESLQPERIKEFTALLAEATDFVRNVYIPDLLAIAAQYKEVAGYGGTRNFIAIGDLCTNPKDLDSGLVKGGVIYDRDLKNVLDVDPDKIAEHVRHSWYKGGEAKYPYDGVTEPNFTDLHGDNRYSWSKAPRYDGHSMETGPLATVLVNYAKGNKPFVDGVNTVLKSLGVGPEALFSSLGRTAARGVETLAYAEFAEQLLKKVVAQAKGKNPQLVADWKMPAGEVRGVGFVNAPRGMLSHWARIVDGKIENFQLVVPTTWSLGPRCAAGKLGPLEESLIGTTIEDASRPVEILRTIHSYDPCIACAVHVIDGKTKEKHVIKVL